MPRSRPPVSRTIGPTRSSVERRLTHGASSPSRFARRTRSPTNLPATIARFGLCELGASTDHVIRLPGGSGARSGTSSPRLRYSSIGTGLMTTVSTYSPREPRLRSAARMRSRSARCCANSSGSPISTRLSTSYVSVSLTSARSATKRTSSSPNRPAPARLRHRAGGRRLAGLGCPRSKRLGRPLALSELPTVISRDLHPNSWPSTAALRGCHACVIYRCAAMTQVSRSRTISRCSHAEAVVVWRRLRLRRHATPLL